MQHSRIRMRWFGLAVMTLVAARLAGCGAQTDPVDKEKIVHAETKKVDGTSTTDASVTSGSKVSVPPGALAVGSDLEVAEATAPAEFAAAGGGATTASQAI